MQSIWNNNRTANSALLCCLACVCLKMSAGSKFSYFAYGSNLLAKRIHINNPSAVRAGIGKLDNYRLDFLTYSNRWKGAAATIVKQDDAHVWGAIWEIDFTDLESLDRQEGVNANIYFRLNVSVVLPQGGTRNCYVYEQCKQPPNITSLDQLPDDRKPSTVYLNTIIKGAAESGLPEEYQKFLKNISHNGYNGEVDLNFVG